MRKWLLAIWDWRTDAEPYEKVEEIRSVHERLVNASQDNEKATNRLMNALRRDPLGDLLRDMEQTFKGRSNVL